MTKHAAFEDLNENGYGALAGAGANVLDRVQTTTSPEGIKTRCYCENCGGSVEVIVEWLEAVYGSLGFMPQDWRVEIVNGTKCLYPFVGCANSGCRRPIVLCFTPVELNGLVNRGVQNQDVNPQWVQGQVNAIKQQVSGLGRR